METEKILGAIQNAAETIAAPNCADKASVFLSLAAVIVAGIVAWRQIGISKKQAEISGAQNKIALFEKRFTVYWTVRKCIYAANKISDSANTLDDIYAIFYVEFTEKQFLDSSDIKEKHATLFTDISDILLQSEFLFSDKISQKVCAMDAYLLLLASLKYKDDSDKMLDKAKYKFCQYAKELESSNILELMKCDLQLQSVVI